MIDKQSSRLTGEPVHNIFGQVNGEATYPLNQDMQRFRKLRQHLSFLNRYTEHFILRMDDEYRQGFLETLENSS